MKKFFSIIALAAASLSANAQGGAADWKLRIGHGQDSIDCVENFMVFNDAVKARTYKEAVEPLKFLLEKAPTARVSLYKTGQAVLQTLLYAKDTDASLKEGYYNLLMKLYDARLANMEVLNSFSSAKDQSSRGGIICRKAYDSYFMAPDNMKDVAKSYAMFKDGINDTGNDTEGFVLYGFIQLSDSRFKFNADKYREDFINDYLLVTDIAGRLLQQANEYPTTVIKGDPENADSTKWEDQVILAPEAQKIIEAYQPAFDNAEALFVQSGAADCDALEKIYRPKVEANKTNNEYLTSVLKALRNFDCTKTDLYELAADYSYELVKTPQAALGKASKALKAGDTDEALKYFNESLSLETDEARKAKIYQAIAVLMYQRGSYSEALKWIDKLPNNGQLLLLKASIVARSGSHKDIMATAPYCLAIDICRRAIAADPSCAGKANKAIANYTANLFPKSEGFMAGIKTGTPASTAYGSTTIRFR